MIRTRLDASHCVIKGHRDLVKCRSHTGAGTIRVRCRKAESDVADLHSPRRVGSRVAGLRQSPVSTRRSDRPNAHTRSTRIERNRGGKRCRLIRTNHLVHSGIYRRDGRVDRDFHHFTGSGTRAGPIGVIRGESEADRTTLRSTGGVGSLIPNCGSTQGAARSSGGGQ